MICIFIVWETLGRSRSEGNNSIGCVQQKPTWMSLCLWILLANSPFQYSSHSFFYNKIILCAFAPRSVLLHLSFPLDVQIKNGTWTVVPASWFGGFCQCCPWFGATLGFVQVIPSPTPRLQTAWLQTHRSPSSSFNICLSLIVHTLKNA